MKEDRDKVAETQTVVPLKSTKRTYLHPDHRILALAQFCLRARLAQGNIFKFKQEFVYGKNNRTNAKRTEELIMFQITVTCAFLPIQRSQSLFLYQST